MRLSIVILSFNTPLMVADCIKSLSSHFSKELKEKQIEIVVVDNASTKENLDKLEIKLKGLLGIKLIKNKENSGFGRGCNLGAENSQGEYVLFLNSDTLVSDRGLLKMTDFLEKNPQVAILGGKLFNPDGTPQQSAGKFYNLINFFIMLVGGQRKGLLLSSPEKITTVDWVSGACFMTKKEIFESLGGFDKELFMYVEDMELCYRAKKSGLKTFFFPDTKIIHREHGSSSRTFAVLNIYKGLMYFYKKHKNFIEYRIVYVALWLKALVIYLLGRITNNYYYISTYEEALKLF